MVVTGMGHMHRLVHVYSACNWSIGYCPPKVTDKTNIKYKYVRVQVPCAHVSMYHVHMYVKLITKSI